MYISIRNLLKFASVAVLASGIGVKAHAQQIYTARFEESSFVAGAPLVGQNGWVGLGFLSPNAAVISSGAAKSGKMGVQVRGADMVGDPIVDPFGAVGSYRRPVNYAANGATILVSSDVQLAGPVSAPGLLSPFFGASIAIRLAGPNGADTYEFQLASDGNFYGFDDNLLSSPIGDPGVFPAAPADLNRWYRMSIAADFTAKTVSFLVNGHTLGVAPFSDPDFDTVLRGAIVVYASPDDATFTRNAYSALFDNFKISQRLDEE